MVSPETVIFAVRALVRVGGAARSAYEQKVRDSDVLMPLPPQLDYDPLDYLRLTFDDPRYRGLVQRGGRLAEHWDAERLRPVDDPASRRILIAAAEEIWQTDLARPRPQWYGGARRQEEAGLLVLQQWAEGSEPPPPLARLVVAIADVAIEYAGAQPGLLGAGSNGERLIGVLATQLREWLPDVDDPRDWPAERWARFYFVERALTIFARASLGTLAAHPDLVVDERHFQGLVADVLSPLVARLDEDPTRAPGLIALRDTLLGPMASVALGALAANPSQLLGRRFSADRATGAITRALLEEASERGDLRVVFSEQGIVGLYRAALGVAADRPALFVDEELAGAERLRRYLSGAAGLLRDAPPPFDAELGAALGVLALELAGELATAALDPSDSWEALARTAIASFLEGVRDGTAAGDARGALDTLLSREQLGELARIFLEQAARTPGMLTGDGASPALRNLVAGVAASLSRRGASLLSGDDWLILATVVAREAARNPGRLFDLDQTEPSEQLTVRAIERILGVAADAFETTGMRDGAVLFGETLREAIELAIESIARNTGAAAEHLDEIAALFARIAALASARPERVGADAALALLAELLDPVVDTGRVLVLRDDGVESVAPDALADDDLIERLADLGGAEA